MMTDRHTPTIFRHFPELEREQAWMSLGTFPTPVTKLIHLGYEDLWIKRDDLSSTVYGGNKVRKLEFILADAQKKNKNHIITPGGIGTNHGVATAIFASHWGFKTTLLLFDQPITSNVKQNLRLMIKYKARTRYKKSLFNAMLAFYVYERIKHPRAYFLYPGGSNVIGTIGYVSAAFELKEQIDKGLLPEPVRIFCPLGSGGTLAGLTLGARLAGLASKVVGVRVSMARLGPIPATTGKTIRNLMQATYDYLNGLGCNLPAVSIREPDILEQYLGNGYGEPTTAGGKAYLMMQDKENIILDPTYTAKTFAAVMDCCEANTKDSKPLLFWNTYNSVDMTGQAASVAFDELPLWIQKCVDARTVYY